MAKKRNVKRAVRAAEKAVNKMSTGQKVALFVVLLIVAVALVLGYFYILKPIFDKNKADGFHPSAAAEGDLRVHFIDVGQGDCSFIEFPDGKCMIIDGGDNVKATEQHLVKYLRDVVKVDKIEYMVLTHTDSDHVGGLDVVLSEFIVEKIYSPEITAEQITTKVYQTFMNAVKNEPNAEQVAIVDSSDINGGNYMMDFFAMADMYADIDDGSTAYQKNGVSPLMFLTYAGKQVLFTGDANDKYTEPAFLERTDINFTAFDVDVLKVAHHGSESSSSAGFLKVVKPEYAVFQCGAGNKHLHPRQAAIDRILEYVPADQIYRNDLNGDIVLTISDTGELNFQMATSAAAEDKTRGADTADTGRTLFEGVYLAIKRINVTEGALCNFLAA